MKKALKLICLMLVGVMMFALLAACGDNNTTSTAPSTDTSSGGESSSEVSTDPELKWKDAEGNYFTGYTKEDLGGYQDTFTILVQGNSDPTYQNVDFTIGDENTATFYGTFVDEGVSERNNKVEENYGVKIIGLKDNSPLTTARNEAQGNSGLFDAMVISASELATLSGEGKLVELTSLESLQLDAPWWDQNANEAFSIANKLYFTTGDITLQNKITTMAIMFNKSLVTDYNLESPYELVKSREWTFDKLIELSKQVPENNVDEIHGLLTGYNDANGWYMSLGGTFTTKNADDIPTISMNSTGNTNRALKMLEAFSERGSFILMAQECPEPIWDTSWAQFYEGKVVFRYSGFSAANKMRDYAVDFGIVPCPLYDEFQEDYIAPAGSRGAIGILITHKNPEWVAKMLDICACGAKNYVTPAYYERTLRGKDTRDDESEDMLDIIFDNLYYDIGNVYDLGGMSSALFTLMQNKSNAFTSTIDGLYATAEKALSEAIDAYKK